MDADFKTNMKEFQKQVREYGKRLTDDGTKKAAVDLSYRASNAVKRDFTKSFYQTPGQGSSGKTVRTGRLRSSINAIVKNDYQFGVTSNVVYAKVHELGIGPYMIRPRNKKFLKFQIGARTIFSKKVRHPGQKARHWMSEPMYKELQEYIKDQITKLEKPL